MKRRLGRKAKRQSDRLADTDIHITISIILSFMNNVVIVYVNNC